MARPAPQERVAARRGVMADRQIFETLDQTIRAHPDAKGDLNSTAHEGTLALSWTLTIDDLKACTYQRALKKAQKERKPLPVQAHEKSRIAKQVHARYSGLKDAALCVDCYIFFKDHSVPPQINDQMAPAFHRAFHATPLHHYFAIWRMQRPNPASGQAEFTDWYAHDATAPGADAAAASFWSETRFPPCPPAPADGNWVRPALIAGAVAGALGLAVLIGIFNEPLARLFGFATPQDRRELEIALQQLREDVAVLREQYATEVVFVEAYENEIARMRTSGGSPREIAELEHALAASQRRVDELNRQLSRAGERLAPARGTGLPACWSAADGRPAYLFEAYLDDRGIRLEFAPGAGERARREALPVHGVPLGTALSVESFTEMTRPVFAASEASQPRCRHYVILREGVHASASAYQRQREAVERHFYIYRP